jgi:hypothetical protein
MEIRPVTFPRMVNPPLILIHMDTEKPMYSAFKGRQHVVTVRAGDHLTAEQVEDFRKDPQGYIEEDKE